MTECPALFYISEKRRHKMKKLIYLDNAATTRTSDEVVEAMLPYFGTYYGNPSSIYDFSAESKQAITDARERSRRFSEPKKKRSTSLPAAANPTTGP